MFLCCIRGKRDSGLRQESYGCLSQSCRHWISGKPRSQHLRGFSYRTSRNTRGNSGKCDTESALTLNVPSNIWSPEAGLLDTVVMNLVPAYQKGDLFYVGAFLHNYRQWGTMEQVLDIVFKKYRFRGHNYEEEQKIKSTLCSIFTMWMDCYPADFRERQNRDTVKELTHYAMFHMPSSDLALRLHILLGELEEPMKKENKKKRKKSLCSHLRACFGRHRAASPDLQRKKPSVMSGAVMDGDLEPSLDSTKHVHVEGLDAFAVRPKEVVIPVDMPLGLNPTGDTDAPVGTLKEVGPDQPQTSQSSTPPGGLDRVSHAGLMENVPSLCAGEPIGEAQILDAPQESASVLTEYVDKSVLLQENQSPTEKLESAPPCTPGENPVFWEEVEPSEDWEVEFGPEGHFEADLDLELPSPLLGYIYIFLFVLIVINCYLYLFF
ncbi:uncharacterized protein [Dipodomys merriami]|uniref:uncharacterized protein n=1 Tax=Dipodomys merriami TaxID=94247 RepID=UPI003855C669